MILPGNETCVRVLMELEGDLELSQWESDFIARCGLREENGHIYVPKGLREPAAHTLAINYLVNEFDYSAGEQPETVRVP